MLLVTYEKFSYLKELECEIHVLSESSQILQVPRLRLFPNEQMNYCPKTIQRIIYLVKVLIPDIDIFSKRGKRKIVDPRQQSIKNFFQVKDAEETGKLESSDRLNLEAADSAGVGGAAAGVDQQSEASPSRESEKRNRKNN